MKTILTLAVAAFTAACAGGLHAGGPVPTPGAYAYTAEYRLPDGSRRGPFTGRLHIDTADPSRISGRWAVAGYDPVLQIGVAQDGGYVANASVRPGTPTAGTFEHRLTVDRSGTIACFANFVTEVGARVVTYPASCTLSRVAG